MTSTPTPAAHGPGRADVPDQVDLGRVGSILQSQGFMTGLVLLGVALRLWAYAANASLWLDEILLSRNIIELPVRTLLTQPLQLDQVAPRGFLLIEKVAVLKPDEWNTGVCDRNETRAYLRDVDRHRGFRRVWVLSAGARPFRVARASVRSYLSAIGVKRDSLELSSPIWDSAGLDLYDLSDSTRLRAATAEGFPVPPMPTDPRPGCRPWARPSPLDRPF